MQRLYRSSNFYSVLTVNGKRESVVESKHNVGNVFDSLNL